MGSGTFPLDRADDLGKIIVGIVGELNMFIDQVHEDVYSGDSGGHQFDNSASDGAYLERLKVASRLISECIRSVEWIVLLKFPTTDPTSKGACPTTYRCSAPVGNIHSVIVTTPTYQIDEAKRYIEAFVTDKYPTATIVRFEDKNTMIHGVGAAHDAILGAIVPMPPTMVKSKVIIPESPTMVKLVDIATKHGFHDSYYDTLDECLVCHRERWVNGGDVQCAECDGVTDSAGNIVPCTKCGSTDIEYQRKGPPRCPKCKLERG